MTSGQRCLARAEAEGHEAFLLTIGYDEYVAYDWGLIENMETGEQLTFCDADGYSITDYSDRDYILNRMLYYVSKIFPDD